MRILIANGAPRRGGFTEELAEALSEGAVRAGGEVEAVRIPEHVVRPCLGCFACWTREDGRCAQRDDMDVLLPLYLRADAIVFATPVYFYAFSAPLKAFIERLLPALLPFIDVEAASGLERNTPRQPGRGPKRAVLIAAGAHRDPRLTAGLVSTFETICHGLSLERAGVLVRPESFLLDFAAGKPKLCAGVRAAFAAAGRELVEAGRIADETERAAGAPLSKNLELFRGHARTYWEIARRGGARSFDRRAVRDAVAGDLRILVPELAASLDPAAAGGLSAVIQFDLEGDAEGGYHLDIAGGECAAHRGRHANPAMTLSLDRDTLVALLHDRVDAREALAEGLIRVSGDRALFTRFGRMFRR